MHHQPLRIVSTAAATALLLAACASDAGPTAAPNTGGDTLPGVPTTDPPGNLGGFGPQAAAPDEFDIGWSTEMAATLEQDDRGCWSLRANRERLFVVLPEGFTDDPSGSAVVTTGGVAIAAGSPVDARGAMIGVDDLPGGADGRWGNLVAFCAPSATAVVVADTLGLDGYDPATLDATALAALVVGAKFEVDWGCGYGFATSTTDQRVGLVVDPATFEPPASGAVTLPDETWRATVIVGEHLFANHCDDVVEWFEPDQEVVARYPLTTGSFEFSPPEPGTEPGGNPVTIVLEGAAVEGPSGPIPLGPITIDNGLYGLFAG